ncbi:DUF6414 family protein [Microbacterium foliorum]
MANNENDPSLTKVVYFDEQSASDLLDMAAGGRAVASSEDVQKRATDMHASTAAKISARFSWLPFVGADASADAGLDLSRATQSMLSKTLSNTILTDYLRDIRDDRRIQRLTNITVHAVPQSMAWMKMFSPYLAVSRDEESPFDPTKLDDALARAKGYYELVGTPSQTGGAGANAESCVLRFNLHAFRNNYGLTDLGRMNLVFDAILVGSTTRDSLSFEAEMSQGAPASEAGVEDLLRSADDPDPRASSRLPVYDVILAAVVHGA